MYRPYVPELQTKYFKAMSKCKHVHLSKLRLQNIDSKYVMIGKNAVLFYFLVLVGIKMATGTFTHSS